MVSNTETPPCNVLYLLPRKLPRTLLARPRFDALDGETQADSSCWKGRRTPMARRVASRFADLEQLEEANWSQHNTRLVIIDPLQSFLGGDVDAHRANQDSPDLRWTHSTCGEDWVCCPLLITRHLSKGLGGSALYRGMGSIDITGAARSELLIAKEPDQESRVVVAQSKNSLAEFGPSLTYSIGSDKKLNGWHGKVASKQMTF